MTGKHKVIAAFLCLSAIAVCVTVLLVCILPDGNSTSEALKVTLLRVGKADAIVVQAGEKTMVIDAGEEEDGEELTDFLKNQGISYVDTLIITHYDKDHVGGADTLAESLKIGRIILPDYSGSGTEYLDFMSVLKQEGIRPQYLTKTEKFRFGNADIRVDPPLSYEAAEETAENDNNFSLITTVTHGENKLVFAGDAEKQRIGEWIASGGAESCDFLKVPHHGVYNTALHELLDETSPKYAVICSSGKNPAQTQTLELLKQYNIRTFQTKDGNVTAISDGKRLEVHQELE